MVSWLSQTGTTATFESAAQSPFQALSMFDNKYRLGQTTNPQIKLRRGVVASGPLAEIKV